MWPGVLRSPTVSHPLWPFTMLASATLLAGCLGSISDPGEDLTQGGPSGGKGSGPSIGNVKEAVGGSSQLRRLTRAEYNNTVRDLLGDTTAPANAFSPDEKALGVAIGGTVTNLLGEQFQDAAEQLAQNAANNLSALTQCQPASAGEDVCAAAVIDEWVPRAFRRALDAEERTRMLALYDGIKAKYGFQTGVEVIVRATLQSPHFLYVVETGEGPAGRIPLTQFELATRMSYFLWSSMPDSTLFAAAKAGKLSTATEIEEQARRMLADSRSVDTVRSFTRQWLELEHLDSLNKDADYYPAFNDALRSAMSEETERFAEYAMLENGSFESLFKSNVTFVNAELAELYGVQAPSSGWTKVTLPAAQRSGILTQASFLATHAHPNQTSPILRGKFVREAVLCQLISPPPPNIDVVVPKPEPGLSTKERFEKHSTDPACANCHKLMDPIGFGFERYDGIGRYREEEVPGKAIDDSGEIIESDVDGPFLGAVELSDKLSQSDAAKDCMTRLWFRFALKRGEDADEYTILQAKQRFKESNYDMRELMVALTTSHGFRFRSQEAQ